MQLWQYCKLTIRPVQGRPLGLEKHIQSHTKHDTWCYQICKATLSVKTFLFDLHASSGQILHHWWCYLCLKHLKEGTALHPQSLCLQLPSLIRTAQALCFYWHHLLSRALANKSSLLSGQRHRLGWNLNAINIEGKPSGPRLHAQQIDNFLQSVQQVLQSSKEHRSVKLPKVLNYMNI